MIFDNNVAFGRQEYKDMLVNNYYSTAKEYKPDVFKAIYSELNYPSELFKCYPPFIYILKIDTDKYCPIAGESHVYNSNYMVINLWKKSYKIKCNKCKSESRCIYFKDWVNDLIDIHLKKSRRN